MAWKISSISLRFYMAGALAAASSSVAAQAYDEGKRDDFAARAFGIGERAVTSAIGDNDVFGDGEDRWYSSGVALKSLLTPDATPWLESSSADMLLGHAPRRLELTLGQMLFTPEELSRSDFIEDDRPYGAFLYVGAEAVTMKPNFQVMGYEALVEDRVGAQLGAVGDEWALGKVTQELAHEVTPRTGTSPEGWGHALDNEPGLNLVASRTYHFYGDLGAVSTEFRPHGAISVGTVNTQAQIGAEIRIGDDLHYDLSRTGGVAGVGGGGFFGAPDGSAWALFGGVTGTAVAHNVFLDGNVFGGGPDIGIQKEVLVVGAHLGFSFSSDNMRLSYVHHFRSKEFEEQDEAQRYGAFTLGLKF